MDKLTKDIPARPQSPAVTLRQLSMRFDNAEVQTMSAAQRARAITHLAGLLMQAAGLTTGKEYDDDER